MTYKQLTREQRYVIYLGLQKGQSYGLIAQCIGVSKSTVCREVQRNATRSGKYVWTKAQASAAARRSRSPGNRHIDSVLEWRIKELIKDRQWSPRQISGWLAKRGVKVSHETIYALVHRDSSGTLASHCRHRMKYKKRRQHRPRETRSTLRNRVSIHQRPTEADGKRFGDWEMDLIVDRHNNAILTLVERSTNFLIMERLKQGRKAMPLATTVWRLLLPFKATLRTITTDNGSEPSCQRGQKSLLILPSAADDLRSKLSCQRGQKSLLILPSAADGQRSKPSCQRGQRSLLILPSAADSLRS